MWAADLAQVKVASISNKKKDGDQSSLQRCLDEVLHMVVEDKTLLNEKTMVYPYDTIKPGESLRQVTYTYTVLNLSVYITSWKTDKMDRYITLKLCLE